MTSQLRNMMAEIESWESAAEFGIPQNLWAGYQVRQRSDDLYIAVLSAIFDVLRGEDSDARKLNLSELAKTLLIYSRSAASKYLTGVDRTINLLYCAATFYLAGFPATATLVVKQISNTSFLSTEEKFLYGLLRRKFNSDNELENQFLTWLSDSNAAHFTNIVSQFSSKVRQGLINDPRLFIVSKLTVHCLTRFKEFNIWDNLRENAANFSREIWQPFLINSHASPLWELFPSQMTAIKNGILGDEDKVYSLQMPTSSGKTSLCEILIYHEVKSRGKRVLFLVPFRALASEIKEGVSKRLESAGVTVIASHGGNIPTRSDNATAESTDVLIITPEKFMALAQSLPGLENEFDTIICDEGHLIDDSSRGLQYELLLTKLKGSDKRTRKIIFISAILPNVDNIHEWLGGKTEQLSKSDYKPVEIDFAFMVSQGDDSWQLEFNTIFARPRSYFLRSFIVKVDFQYLNRTTNRLNLIKGRKSYTTLACVAALKARRNGPVAIFTTQKNHVSNLSDKMLEMSEKYAHVMKDSPNAALELPNLIEYITFQFGTNYSLSQLLKYGIGFHHGDLPQEIRREMENAIQNGAVNILICTSTLAEGVNLPIRTLVVHTIKRHDGSVLQYIEKRSIKNIVGRVGRAGKETRGRIIFANNKERTEVENVFRDINMEPAYGALYRLIESLNRVVIQRNIKLSNEIFEAQDVSFLSILDKIDSALIDLIPPEVVLEEIEKYVEGLLEGTLAYKYCVTDTLKSRIKEVFVLRVRHLQAVLPRERWAILKRSGSSPRFWKSVHELGLLQRPEWQSLTDAMDTKWIDEVLFKLIDASSIKITCDRETLRKAIIGWMVGHSYGEIADICNIKIDDLLELLCHTVGYELQDSLTKLSLLAASYHGDDNISEMASSWPSLLQYGLYDLQQLDLFEKGASDRLGVWGISRYLKLHNILLRKKDLLSFLRHNANNIINYLNQDPRVPTLSKERTCEELKIHLN
ncbi:DEAD/DEAH box helicase [Legionella pneumophila serogroup 1]